MENKAQAQPFAPRRERGMDSFRRSMRRSMRRSGKMGSVSGMIRGVLVAASITVLGIAVFALILSWWNASDRAVTAINQVVKFVSILAGVSSALDTSVHSGAMRGACVGLIYMVLGAVCHGLLMGTGIQLTPYLADMGMGIAAGGLFGMILTGRKAG